MVRKYIKKNNKIKKYSSDTLKLALSDIKNGLSIRGASKNMRYRFLTLQHAKKGTSTVGVDAGRPSAIPPIEEKKLANGHKTLERWGWGLSRKEVFEVIAEVVISNNIKTPFENGYREEDWFLGFKKRNNLSIKKPQSLEFARNKHTQQQRTAGCSKMCFSIILKKSFLLNCVPERPILLIFYGHSTHLSFKSIELAISNNITILY